MLCYWVLLHMFSFFSVISQSITTASFIQSVCAPNFWQSWKILQVNMKNEIPTKSKLIRIKSVMLNLMQISSIFEED